MKRITQAIPHPLKFFACLKWIDGTPLLDHIEPYRRRNFEEVLWTFDEAGRLFYNMALHLRSKKNWKSADLILFEFYALMCWKVSGGFIGRLFAFDEQQSKQNLDLLKKIIAANPLLNDALILRQKDVERKDGGGIIENRAGGDYKGTHGGTSDADALDEVHTLSDWRLLEALQPATGNGRKGARL